MNGHAYSPMSVVSGLLLEAMVSDGTRGLQVREILRRTEGSLRTALEENVSEGSTVDTTTQDEISVLLEYPILVSAVLGAAAQVKFADAAISSVADHLSSEFLKHIRGKDMS